MKTTFSSGVIVTSSWLNGAQQIYFDNQDLDWHYPPLGISSMVTSGTDGLDGRYITLSTDQPVLEVTGPNAGSLVSGQPISGTKVVTGPWMFGYDLTVNPTLQNVVANAPKSYTTNSKYNNGGSSAAQKFAALGNADILTKLVVSEQIADLLDNLEIDNGVYYSATNPMCNNYGGSPTVICPV